MHVDAAHQPCPHCARPTVLVTDRVGRRWLHLGTWRTQCGPPELAWLEAEMVGSTPTDPRFPPHPQHAPDVRDKPGG
jgi:hypothetical protein